MAARVKPIRTRYDDRFSLLPVLWGLGVGLAWGLGELAVSAFSVGYLSRVYIAPVLLTNGAAGFLLGVVLCVVRSVAGVQGWALVAATLIWWPALLYTALKVQVDLLPTHAWWQLPSLFNLLLLGALGLWGAHRSFIRLFEPKVRVDLAALVGGGASLAITLLVLVLFARIENRFPSPVWAWLSVVALPLLLDRAGRDLTRVLSQLSGTQQSRGRYALAALLAFLLLSGWEYFDQRGRLPHHLPGRPAGSSDGPYNLILIVLSGVRADHLTAYGYGAGGSPVLASLARAADRYERCYSTSSRSELATASLLSALPPSLLDRQTREPEVQRGLGWMETRRESTSLAPVLRSMGYRTVAIVADAEIASMPEAFSEGFDVYDARPRLRLAHSDTPLVFTVQARLRPLFAERLQKLMPWFRGEYLYRFQPHRTVEEVLQATAFRLRETRRRPLFLFLQLMDARLPLVPPVEFLPSGEGVDQTLWGGLSSEEIEQINCGDRALSRKEIKTLQALYDAEIQYMDRWLGQLLESLENTGVLPRSLVVIAADCGMVLGEGEYLGTGLDLAPAALHVPLIVKHPGEKQGRRFAEPVSLAQVKSLVLRELGVTYRPGPGEYVFDPQLDQLLVAEWTPPPEILASCRDAWPRQLKAAIRGRRMLVTDLESERRLYDLGVAGTTQPLPVEEASAEVAYLEQQLQAWMASWAEEETTR